MSDNSDIGDNASRTEEQWRDRELAAFRTRRAVEETAPINWSGLCIDCEETIDPRRIAANPRAARCVSCQQDDDKRNRR